MDTGYHHSFNASDLDSVSDLYENGDSDKDDDDDYDYEDYDHDDYDDDYNDDDDDHDSNSTTRNPIVSKDPSKPIDLDVDRPSLIRDILRTRYCVLGSVFLVEGIEARVLGDEDEGEGETYDDDDDYDGKEAEGRGGKRRKFEKGEEEKDGGKQEKEEEEEKRDGQDFGGKEPLRGGRQQMIKEEERKPRHKRRRKKRRAVRVMLGDGELCIQALLKAEAHWLVDRELVWEGCYVRVDKMELGFIEPGEKGGDREAYLLVEDMVTVGWNRQFLRIIGKEEPRVESEVTTVQGGFSEEEEQEVQGGGKKVEKEDLAGEKDFDVGDGDDEELEELMRLAEEMAEIPRPPGGDKDGERFGSEASREYPIAVQDFADPPPAQKGPPIKQKEEELDYISGSDDEAFQALEVSPDRVLQRRATLAAQKSSQQNPEAATQQPIQQQQQQQQQKPPPPLPPLPPQPPPITDDKPPPRPWMANDPTQPLKLTLLQKIPHLPYKQNWMVNVLCVVVSLSEVEGCTIPPYVQRTAWIADASTTKHVHLTVFLDPAKFTPRLGSVVLLVGVKNHRFDGGSLKKYMSDKAKKGMSWWVQEPGKLGWCEGEVRRLEEWWRGKEPVGRLTRSEKGKV